MVGTSCNNCPGVVISSNDDNLVEHGSMVHRFEIGTKVQYLDVNRFNV